MKYEYRGYPITCDDVFKALKEIRKTTQDYKALAYVAYAKQAYKDFGVQGLYEEVLYIALNLKKTEDARAIAFLGRFINQEKKNWRSLKRG